MICKTLRLLIGKPRRESSFPEFSAYRAISAVDIFSINASRRISRFLDGGIASICSAISARRSHGIFFHISRSLVFAFTFSPFLTLIAPNNLFDAITKNDVFSAFTRISLHWQNPDFEFVRYCTGFCRFITPCKANFDRIFRLSAPLTLPERARVPSRGAVLRGQSSGTS